MRILIICGTFDNNGGKPSAVAEKITDTIFISGINIDRFNGGYLNELPMILATVPEYDYVMYMADTPNNHQYVKSIKEINPKCILVTSVRNDNETYTFQEMINYALGVKANLCIEFSLKGTMFYMNLFDPLGNSWYNGDSTTDIANTMVQRMIYLHSITRQGTIHEDGKVDIPDEPEFFEIIKNHAETFHELIQPAKTVTRFLGNSSFRCMRGFPSFKKDGMIFVSRRNVDKRYIDKDAFVPVKFENNNVYYYGDNKPSVDTPIQVRLYEVFKNINYMIHSHVYIESAPFTEHMVPCGGIEEVNEILNLVDINTNGDFYAINLIGHGSIVMANRASQLKNIRYKARTIPENFHKTV